MKTTLIKNFVGILPIELSAWKLSGREPVVSINQRGGGMSFQHAMTPDQAREMAAALVALADSFIEVAA